MCTTCQRTGDITLIDKLIVIRAARLQINTTTVSVSEELDDVGDKKPLLEEFNPRKPQGKSKALPKSMSKLDESPERRGKVSDEEYNSSHESYVVYRELGNPLVIWPIGYLLGATKKAHFKEMQNTARKFVEKPSEDKRKDSTCTWVNTTAGIVEV